MATYGNPYHRMRLLVLLAVGDLRCRHFAKRASEWLCTSKTNGIENVVCWRSGRVLR